MLTVRGKFKDGIARPNHPVAKRGDEDVLIVFLDDDGNESTPSSSTDWDALSDIIAGNQVETGVSDLAYQHDHYLYGSPQREQS